MIEDLSLTIRERAFPHFTTSLLACFSIFVPILRSQVICERNQDPRRHDVRPVTVVDAIQMTKYVGSSAYDGGTSAQHNAALFSPDGKRFVIATKKGNIEKNTNDYSLLLFQTNRGLRSPVPEVLVSLSSSSNRPAIQDIKWVDDRTVAFLGENPGESQQLYEVNCETRRIARLTNHSTNVITYAIAPNEERFFFLANRPVKSIYEERTEREGVIVSSQPLTDLLAGERRWGSEAFADLYMKLRSEDQETLVRTRADLVPGSLWLSPNAQYVIATVSVAAIPDNWKDYEDRWLQERVRATPLHGDSPLLLQYSLLDMRSGRTDVLLDAPLGDGDSEVLWSPDSKSVVVSGVYLPLDVPDAAERKLRQSKKMIVEIKIPSLEIVPISSREFCSLQCALRWDPPSGKLLVEPILYSTTSGGDGVSFAFQKATLGWTQVQFPRLTPGRSDPVAVTLEEGMNAPPRLFVTDLQTGQKSLLLDLNPEFKHLSFGSVQDITFRATDGHNVRAGLYLPRNHVQGKKYPLVIQTHGWNPQRFWIDGPWPSGFAAQPLAGQGFIVLQLEEDTSITSTPEEAPRESSAYEGGIEYLDSLQMIDRGRVGLIGFSRTGLGVEYALTHSKYHFAAATIADGSDGGYFAYLSVLPSFSWRWPDFEGINAGSPFGDGIVTWLKKSPGFNLAAVTTPVREEAYEPYSVLFAWEWFAGLSRLHKPVELVYIPNAAHVLVRPLDRLISQQGNVDWFCFWLKDEEDTDPDKAEQYARWRELRNLQYESVKNPRAMRN